MAQLTRKSKQCFLRQGFSWVLPLPVKTLIPKILCNRIPNPELELSTMEGLSKSEANMTVYVHPSQGKNVDKAMLRELSSLLFKYSKAFDGVVLAYSVDPLDKCAKILSGVHPYFGVKLKANMLIFSPKPDMLLEGKVVKITRESIHCIVLGFSSAIITDENIRNELKYKSKHGEGVYVSRDHKRHVIKVGAVIRFVVKSMDEDILHISGSLIPANTGSVHWLDKYFVDSATDSNRKTKTEETEMQEQVTVGGETSPLVNDHHIKMSKKRRRAEDH